jgi:excisionase family DNA binding protein
MVEDKLLTIREASLILGISEQEVIDLAESSKLPAYKVGGVYLRFKREQLEEFKKAHKLLSHTEIASHKSSFKDKVVDFLYFYDFYILTILIIILMLVIIFRG